MFRVVMSLPRHALLRPGSWYGTRATSPCLRRRPRVDGRPGQMEHLHPERMASPWEILCRIAKREALLYCCSFIIVLSAFVGWSRPMLTGLNMFRSSVHVQLLPSRGTVLESSRLFGYLHAICWVSQLASRKSIWEDVANRRWCGLPGLPLNMATRTSADSQDA